MPMIWFIGKIQLGPKMCSTKDGKTVAEKLGHNFVHV